MSKIDLISNEWTDLVFEGRNQAYGAYKLRKGTAKRNVWALIIVGLAAALLYLGLQLQKMAEANKKGLIYDIKDDEKLKAIEDELYAFDVEDLKETFKGTYRNAKRAIAANKVNAKTSLLSFRDDIAGAGFDVDSYIADRLELKQLNAEVAQIEESYKEIFGEDIK